MSPYVSRPRRMQLLVIGLGLIFVLCIVSLIGNDDRCDQENQTLSRVPNLLTSDQVKRLLSMNVQSLVDENEARRKLVRQVCERHKTTPSTSTLGEIWASKQTSLAFCIVPKVGCTYWKRIMRFLENDVDYDVMYPSDIDRYTVHYGGLQNLKQFFIDKPGHLEKVDPGIKFMFARDPYTRLWSAYLDKFYLPDFWHIARKADQELRTKTTTMTSQTCGSDVTFEEFLTYNYNHRNDAEDRLNEHFATITYNCDPCKVDFDVIGKAETFKSDTDLILARAGLIGKVPEDQKLDRVTEEIATLVDYNLEIRDYLLKITTLSANCFDDFDIARRLWKVFQFNGYVGEDISFPEKEFRTLSGRKAFKHALKSRIMKLRQDADKDMLFKWKLQRVASMQNAYNSLSMDLIRKFKEMYAIDFELFHYEIQPDWLKKK